MKNNYLKFMVFLGLVISLVFSVAPTYEVVYQDAENTGDISWGSVEKKHLFDSNEESTSYFSAVYTGSQLCTRVLMYDNTEEGVADYLFISTSSGFTQCTKVDGECDIFTMYESYWTVTLCISYEAAGIIKGENYLDGVEIFTYDGDQISYWWPEAWPDDGSGRFYSSEGWEAPCGSDSDCELNEVCAAGSCYVFECASYQEYGTDGENHICTLQEDKCLVDSDCESHKECNIDNHECKLKENACDGSGDCENGYACQGNQCVLVGGEQPPEVCEDECCSNDDCQDHKYCDGGNCELKNGKCDTTNDCDSDEKCVSNSCVEKEVVEFDCEGEVNLQLSYLESTNKLKAIISGINNCEGKTVTVNLDNCNGDIKCAFESGDEGGYCEFNAPAQAGTYEYYGCVDLDGDGTKEFDKEIYLAEGTDDGEDGSDGDGSDEQGEDDQDSGDEVDEEAKEDAEQEIEDAEDAIEEAEDEGKEVATAEQKLEQAQEAFDSGNYDLAKELAEEASALAQGTAPWWMDNQNLMLGGLVVLGLAVVYLLASRFFPKKPEKKE